MIDHGQNKRGEGSHDTVLYDLQEYLWLYPQRWGEIGVSDVPVLQELLYSPIKDTPQERNG